MSQQEQNTASTKAFMLECIDFKIDQVERAYDSFIFAGWITSAKRFKAKLKELKIRRQEVCEMLEGVEDE